MYNDCGVAENPETILDWEEGRNLVRITKYEDCYGCDCQTNQEGFGIPCMKGNSLPKIIEQVKCFNFYKAKQIKLDELYKALDLLI